MCVYIYNLYMYNFYIQTHIIYLPEYVGGGYVRVNVVSMKTRRGCWVPQSCNCRQMWVAHCEYWEPALCKSSKCSEQLSYLPAPPTAFLITVQDDESRSTSPTQPDRTKDDGFYLLALHSHLNLTSGPRRWTGLVWLHLFVPLPTAAIVNKYPFFLLLFYY